MGSEISYEELLRQDRQKMYADLDIGYYEEGRHIILVYQRILQETLEGLNPRDPENKVKIIGELVRKRLQHWEFDQLLQIEMVVSDAKGFELDTLIREHAKKLLMRVNYLKNLDKPQ